MLLQLSCSEPKHVDTSLNTQIEVEDTTYDFGTFTSSDEDPSHTFKIKNTGTNFLVINNVNTSCGCIGIKDYTKEPVSPGDDAKIIVYYNTQTITHGRFVKDVNIYYNGENTGFFRFKVTGEFLE